MLMTMLVLMLSLMLMLMSTFELAVLDYVAIVIDVRVDVHIGVYGECDVEVVASDDVDVRVDVGVCVGCCFLYWC